MPEGAGAEDYLTAEARARVEIDAMLVAAGWRDVVPAGYDPELRWDGLGILPYCLLPHYKSDHPESAGIDQTLEYMVDHHLPFKALRDGEVLVKDGDREFVGGSVRTT